MLCCYRLYLLPIELRQPHVFEHIGIGDQLPGAQADGPHHFEVEQAQFPVGDHEEIAAAASRVEEAQLVQLVPEGRQLLFVLPHGLELLPQFIEEQRFDEP